MTRKALVWLSVSCTMMVGCASLNYEARHRLVQSNAVNSIGQESIPGDIPFDSRIEEVQVFNDYAVKGFVYDDKAHELKAVPGTGNKVIGHVHLHFPHMKNPYLEYWFRDYRPEESWRAAMCHPQVPLTWLTLGIWSIIPTYYVCINAPWHVGVWSVVAGKQTRKKVLLDGIRAEAVRVEGNAVLGFHVNPKTAFGWIVVHKR